MGDDTALRRLVEMLSEYFTMNKAVEEDLEHSLTGEFVKNFQDVLFTKRLIVFNEWEHFFHVCGDRMLSSPEMYLRYVFYACKQVALVEPCIFERFLDAFALVLIMSIETNSRKRVNFFKLIPDIVMVLYKKELKKQFLKNGGLCQLVEYVNNPDYLETVCYVRNTSVLYARDNFNNEKMKELDEKLKKALPKIQKVERSVNFVEAEMDKTSSFLANCVLKDTRVELPPLPFHYGSKLNPSDLIQQRITESDKEKGFLEFAENVGDFEKNGDPILDCHLKTENPTLGQMLNTDLYEKIIEKVIKHNQSRSSSHKKTKSSIQMEADGVLNHLSVKIQSLIQVLNDSDKK